MAFHAFDDARRRNRKSHLPHPSQAHPSHSPPPQDRKSRAMVSIMCLKSDCEAFALRMRTAHVIFFLHWHEKNVVVFFLYLAAAAAKLLLCKTTFLLVLLKRENNKKSNSNVWSVSRPHFVWLCRMLRCVSTHNKAFFYGSYGSPLLPHEKIKWCSASR